MILQATITLTPDQVREIALEVVRNHSVSEPVKSLTIREFSKAVGISAQSVRRRIKAGIIRASKSDGIVRIPSTEIQRFLSY